MDTTRKLLALCGIGLMAAMVFIGPAMAEEPKGPVNPLGAESTKPNPPDANNPVNPLGAKAQSVNPLGANAAENPLGAKSKPVNPLGADANAANPLGAAAQPKSIIGTWETAEGAMTFRADGTVAADGKEGKYELDDKVITLSDGVNWLKIPYKLDGDDLILGSGPSKTLKRSNGKPAAAQAGGPAAGVWSVTESSIDPKFVMVISQYVTLYPDGSVGYAKTEGGATRTQISEHLERFRSFKNQAGGQAGNAGRWQADANGNVTIQWSGKWAGTSWRGQINPRTGKLTFAKSGILNEGDTLAFEKQ